MYAESNVTSGTTHVRVIQTE